MKYTIQEILPGQIRVEYEDNSWAIVPILPESTVEEIDDAVSKYDPEFLPSVVELINSNIAIGLERTSTPKIEKQEELSLIPTVPDPDQIIANDFSKISIYDYLIAEYFSNLGDTRLKKELTKKIKAFVESSQFFIEDAIDRITISDDDIMKQAEEELNNGK
jgi:hypothetical protein